MKTITPDQIKAAAQALDVPVAALKAVMEVECRGSGFNADGTPLLAVYSSEPEADAQASDLPE